MDKFTWGPDDLMLVSRPFADVFRTSDPQRDKFLSRLFGLFSEEVVRDWCASPRSRYADLGRPTLIDAGERRGYTLDFALQPEGTDSILVAEMKCELEFEGYKYLTLERADQIDHHRSPAFLRFRELSKDPTRYEARVEGELKQIIGTVLVWGAVTPSGRAAAIARYGFADVLSVEEMLTDLHSWGDETPWPARVERLRAWSSDLFDELAGRPRPL